MAEEVKKRSAAERAREVEALIRSIWSSLESHLPYTHEKSPEGVRFHKRCVKEYTEQIAKATKLY